MKQIRIRLLGLPAVHGADGVVRPSVVRQQKLLALLAYCCIEGRQRYLDADTLAELLWPASDAPRGPLNQTLYLGRKLLGQDIWDRSATGALRIRPDSVECDVAYLLHGGPDAAWVAAHCVGELLPGLRLTDAPAFDDWLDRQRSIVRRRAAEVLIGGARPTDDDDSLAYVRRALELDPFSEAAALRLVALLEARGARADAWQFFEEFRARLSRELDLAPSAELTRAALRACATPPPEAPAAASETAPRGYDDARSPVPPTTAGPEGPATARPTSAPDVTGPAPAATAKPREPLPARGWPRDAVAIAALGVFAVFVVALGVWLRPQARAEADLPAAWSADLVIAGGSSVAGAAWDAGVASRLASRLAEGGMRIARVIGRDDVPAVAPFRLRGSLTADANDAAAIVELQDIRSGVVLASWRLDASAADPGGLARLADSIRTALRHAHAVEPLQRESRSAAAVAALIEARRELDEGRLAAFHQGARDVGALRLLRADSLARVAARSEPRWAQPHLLRAEALELRAIHARAAGDIATTHSLLQQAVDAADTAIERGAADEGRELRGALRHVQWVMNAPGAATLMESAIHDLESAIRHGIADVRAWVSLSALYNATGRADDAYAAAHEALTRDAFGRRRDEILMRLFQAAFYAGRDNEAAHWCTQIVERAPHREHAATCRLSVMLNDTAALPHDIAALRFDLKAEPPPLRQAAIQRLELYRAAVLARLGQHRASSAALQTYGSGIEHGSEALFPLAAAHAWSGDLDQARSALQRYMAVAPAPRSAMLLSPWLRPLHDAAGPGTDAMRAIMDIVPATQGTANRR